jgi:KDPG and KHG aldolase
VIVNGKCAIEDGRPTGLLAGRAPADGSGRKADRMTSSAMSTILADWALAVVRAPDIPDPVALAGALAQSGIRALEFTFTTPGVLDHLRAATASEAVLGIGTVLTADQARAAVDAGAKFLVTPGIRVEVGAVCADSGIPVIMGALTPSRTMPWRLRRVHPQPRQRRRVEHSCGLCRSVVDDPYVSYLSGRLERDRFGIRRDRGRGQISSGAPQ